MNVFELFNILLAKSTEAPTNPQENWGLVFSTVATGLTLVFIILTLFIVIFKIVGAILKNEKPKRLVKTADANKKILPAQYSFALVHSEPVKEQAPPTIPENRDDLALIAVIAASIEAYRASENLTGGYKIIAVRKRTQSGDVGANWAMKG